MIKKFILFFACLLITGVFSVNSQTLFSEDFSSGTIDTSIITLKDEDGLTINPSISPPFPATASWVVLQEQGNQNYYAASTSWFEPEGCCADDWMILPSVSIGDFTALSWRAMAVDASFPDGYEVRISTAGTDIADFMANPPLLAVPAENSTWTEREILLFDEGYTNTDVHIAFRNNSDDKFILRLDDIEIFEIPSLDAAVEGLIEPTTVCEKTNSEVVTITVSNSGVNDISNFEVYYSVNGGAPVTEVITDTLAFTESMNYTFQQTVDMSQAGPYEFTIGVNLTNDENPDNDEIDELNVFTLEPQDVSADPLTMGFGPSDDFLGWIIEDANDDGVTWRITDFSPNSGDFSAGYFWNEFEDADDWLFTRCLHLESSNYYVVEFYHSIAPDQNDYFERMKVNYGNMPASGSMTELVVDLGLMTNDFYQPSTNVISPASSGTYHVGFHAYSDRDEWALLVDDITVRQLEVPNVNFNYSINDLTVDFNDLSTELPNNWDWDFGVSGGVSTQQNPTFTYDDYGTYNVCMVASNQAGSGTAHCEEILLEPIGIDDIYQISELSVYPNPVKDQININVEFTDFQYVNITLKNNLGQSISNIYEGEVNQGSWSLNMKNLPAGVYFIELKGEEFNHVEKVVVTH
ncbi:MAG: T9SS C-terminal target domain-containing protein [Chitinophagaceae bacterium]|nr:MAG: T9SS C-terminal target domain-containing protein [Chitinophagaceae bacterium]